MSFHVSFWNVTQSVLQTYISRIFKWLYYCSGFLLFVQTANFMSPVPQHEAKSYQNSAPVGAYCTQHTLSRRRTITKVLYNHFRFIWLFFIAILCAMRKCANGNFMNICKASQAKPIWRMQENNPYSYTYSHIYDGEYIPGSYHDDRDYNCAEHCSYVSLRRRPQLSQTPKNINVYTQLFFGFH